MSRKRVLLPFVAALATIVMAGCATTQRGPAEWDGLVRQPDTRLDAVFLKPDAEIPSYSSFLIAPASVQFARNWDPSRGGRSLSRRLDAGDVTAIKDDLSAMLGQIFREELTAAGYQVVDQPGPDTLLVIPAIVDLYITAPDTTSAGRTRTYTANPGRMTLVLELRDSVTGETLARVVDSRSGRNTGFMTVANRATNTAEARAVMRTWARALRSGLDGLHKGGA